MTQAAPVLPEQIEAAQRRIGATLRPTPVVRSAALGAATGTPVHLKLEHLQETGSFKLRGATNAVLSLPEAARNRGVIAASTGNHGRALAFAARASGARCVVCMSRLVPQNKIDAIRALGADIRITGASQDDAQDEVDRLVRDEGFTMIPPFDHPDVIAGQGTLGLEIAAAVPDLAVALIPLSGGGLIAGVAAALKARLPEVRVIGVTMERGAAMYAARKAGHPVPVEEVPTLADSLGGGIGLANRHTFAMTQALVDDVVLVSESEIAQGIRHAYWHECQIVEGAGAVGIAALLSGKVRPEGPALALLSGGNIDMALHHRIISGEDVDLTKE